MYVNALPPAVEAMLAEYVASPVGDFKLPVGVASTPEVWAQVADRLHEIVQDIGLGDQPRRARLLMQISVAREKAAGGAGFSESVGVLAGSGLGILGLLLLLGRLAR